MRVSCKRMKEEKQQLCEALQAFSRSNGEGTEGDGGRRSPAGTQAGQLDAHEVEPKVRWVILPFE